MPRNAKKRTARRAVWLRKQKEKPCKDCRIQHPYWVMQFDHIGPKKYRMQISQASKLSRNRLDEELAKCEIVCANCHAERTHQRLVARQKSLSF